MLFIAASSSCWDEPAHHLRCGWQNGSVCRALEEGERGEEKKEGGGGLFPPSRLERDAKASPRDAGAGCGLRDVCCRQQAPPASCPWVPFSLSSLCFSCHFQFLCVSVIPLCLSLSCLCLSPWSFSNTHTHTHTSLLYPQERNSWSPPPHLMAAKGQTTPGWSTGCSCLPTCPAFKPGPPF